MCFPKKKKSLFKPSIYSISTERVQDVDIKDYNKGRRLSQRYSCFPDKFSQIQIQTEDLGKSKLYRGKYKKHKNNQRQNVKINQSVQKIFKDCYVQKIDMKIVKHQHQKLVRNQKYFQSQSSLISQQQRNLQNLTSLSLGFDDQEIKTSQTNKFFYSKYMIGKKNTFLDKSKSSGQLTKFIIF